MLLRTASTLVLVTAAAVALPARAPAAPRAVVLGRAVDRIVRAGAPGAVLVVRDGGRTIRIARGRARMSPAARMRADDRFRVGSVTKPLVATVVLQLATEGRLWLDDNVERWLPGTVPGGAGITVRSLLDMTSGLFDYLNDGDETVAHAVERDPARRWRPEEIIGIAVRHPPHFPPGAGWAYCNTCYLLLGLIAEKASGRPMAELLRERISGPLGLRHTSLPATPAIAGRHAHGYERSKGTLMDVTRLNPTVAWTAGGLVSSAGDLATFLGALAGGRLLGPDALRAMRTTVSMGESGQDYGLGLVRLESPCGPIEGHDGSIPGYRSFALTTADGRRQAALVANLGEGSFTRRTAAAYEAALRVAICPGA